MPVRKASENSLFGDRGWRKTCFGTETITRVEEKEKTNCFCPTLKENGLKQDRFQLCIHTDTGRWTSSSPNTIPGSCLSVLRNTARNSNWLCCQTETMSWSIKPSKDCSKMRLFGLSPQTMILLLASGRTWKPRLAQKYISATHIIPGKKDWWKTVTDGSENLYQKRSTCPVCQSEILNGLKLGSITNRESVWMVERRMRSRWKWSVV